MTLDIRATLAERGLDVDLQLDVGGRVAVLGPNGAGKSSLLGILAGTVRPDSGRAALVGRVLFDLGGPLRTWVPPHARKVALLAQDALLFPHLSVIGNVAFGPRVTGCSRLESLRLAEHWLAEVDATELAGRRPSELSGGEAQRVAIARALAARPGLLLLDEPLAALDVAVAPLLRRMLRRVLRDQPAIIVTHDLLDALLLADRVVVIVDGEVAESGPTDEVLRHPKTRFTARIAGLNMVRGHAAATGVRQPGGPLLEGRGIGDLVEGEPAVAVFGPQAVAVYVQPVSGSPRNVMGVVITELEPLGDLVRVRGADGRGHVLTADVTARSVAELDLYPGRHAHFSVKAAEVTLYPI